MSIVPVLGDRAIWTIYRQLVDVETRISPFIGLQRISDDCGRMVGLTAQSGRSGHLAV
jgi:hypothetical protein